MERNMVSLFLLAGEEVLLLHRAGGRVASGLWVAACGGHMEKDELNDARRAAIREMGEELGLEKEDIRGLKLRYITLRNTGEEIRQNFYFFAGIDRERPLTSSEGELRWAGWQEALSLPMPFSARQVLTHYFEKGQHTPFLYCGAGGKEKMVFTPLEAF